MYGVCGGWKVKSQSNFESANNLFRHTKISTVFISRLFGDLVSLFPLSLLFHSLWKPNKILKLSPIALSCWLIPSASSQNVFFLDWEPLQGLGWPRKRVSSWAPWTVLSPPSCYFSWFSPTQLVAQMPRTILSYRSRGWAVVSMTTTHTWISEVMCAQRKEQAGQDDIHVSRVCNTAGAFP